MPELLWRFADSFCRRDAVRALSTGEMTTALRPFYFTVHPDLFGQYPTQRVSIRSIYCDAFTLLYFKSHILLAFEIYASRCDGLPRSALKIYSEWSFYIVWARECFSSHLSLSSLCLKIRTCDNENEKKRTNLLLSIALFFFIFLRCRMLFFFSFVNHYLFYLERAKCTKCARSHYRSPEKTISGYRRDFNAKTLFLDIYEKSFEVSWIGINFHCYHFSVRCSSTLFVNEL